jgi:hypothetical protein
MKRLASTSGCRLRGGSAHRVDPAARALREAGRFGDGLFVPLVLHRELGYGWMYLETATAGSIAEKALPTPSIPVWPSGCCPPAKARSTRR